MRKTIAIYKKDLKSYFLSPIAYVSIGFFLILSSLFFYLSTIGTRIATMEFTFWDMMLFFLFIAPILTMRLIAEEKRAGTDQLLLTCPLRPINIVLGKYFAAFTVYLVMLLITIVFPAILYYYSKIDLGPVFSGYLGLILVGGAFISLGLFASSVTESQIIAGIIGIASLLLFWSLGWLGSTFEGNVKKVFESLTLTNHFNSFQTGILDTGDIFYYLSFIFIFLYLTVRVIEKRKWSRG